MQLGMIGLGRIGASLVRRLPKDGHPCVVSDLSTQAIASRPAARVTRAGMELVSDQRELYLVDEGRCQEVPHDWLLGQALPAPELGAKASRYTDRGRWPLAQSEPDRCRC